MAAWLIPALKLVLPHIGTIVSVAAPVFTKKKAEAAASQALMQQQIAELQQAASENAALIKELAAQLQTTVTALEEAADIAEAKLRWALLLCIAAAILSAVSLGVVLWPVLAR